MSKNSGFAFGGKGGKDLGDFANRAQTSRTRRFFRVIDPWYWAAYALCLPVTKLPLSTTESNIIELNIEKHRFVLFITTLFSLLAWWGIATADTDSLNELVVALLAPAFVTGGAWFAITFGGVQEKLLGWAVSLTKWMFAAFSISLITMFIALAHIVPWQLTVVLAVITFLVMLSAITYDNVDSLKIGLDDALRRHSLTMMAKLGAEDGIWPPIDSDDRLRNWVEQNRKVDVESTANGRD